jgi:GTP-binding protein HflX
VELVLNKVDRLDAAERHAVANRHPGALEVSAMTGEGLDALRERISELFASRFEDVRLLVPYEDGAALSALYALGAPISERRDTDEGVWITARLPQREARRFARYLVADHQAEPTSGA